MEVLTVIKIKTLMFISFIFLWIPEHSTSVRLIELRVPAHAAAGGEALLGCQFDVGDDLLYSVKWYKDGREFFRYVPKNKNPVYHFSQPGVHVDVSRSFSNVVTLMNISRESAGLYRCEVSGEAPLFATAGSEKLITVHVLPEKGPIITGLKKEYKVSDRVALNCTSLPSKPEAQLKWLINDRAAAKSLIHGPWMKAADPLDTTETVLQLKFVVKTYHFKNGVLKLTCQASIAPLYQQSTMHHFHDPDLTTLAPETEVTPADEYDEEDPSFSRIPEIAVALDRIQALHNTGSALSYLENVALIISLMVTINCVV